MQIRVCSIHFRPQCSISRLWHSLLEIEDSTIRENVSIWGVVGLTLYFLNKTNCPSSISFWYCFLLVYTPHKNVLVVHLRTCCHNMRVCYWGTQIQIIAGPSWHGTWTISCWTGLLSGPPFDHNTSSAYNNGHMAYLVTSSSNRCFSIRFTFKLWDLALMWWDAIRDHLGLCPFCVLLSILVVLLHFVCADLRGIQTYYDCSPFAPHHENWHKQLSQVGKGR